MLDFKKTFRKFAIKFFALDYIVKIFGKRISWTRSANIVYPLMVLLGILSVLQYKHTLLVLLPIVLSVFMGFFYFQFFPLSHKDYDFLDEVQKKIYVNFKKGVKIELEESDYNKSWIFWVNPIVTLIFVLIFLIK